MLENYFIPVTVLLTSSNELGIVIHVFIINDEVVHQFFSLYFAYKIPSSEIIYLYFESYWPQRIKRHQKRSTFSVFFNKLINEFWHRENVCVCTAVAARLNSPALTRAKQTSFQHVGVLNVKHFLAFLHLG